MDTFNFLSSKSSDPGSKIENQKSRQMATEVEQDLFARLGRIVQMNVPSRVPNMDRLDPGIM
jgi:hypothetical protein